MAVLVDHQAAELADMSALLSAVNRHGVAVIEDAAQALGPERPRVLEGLGLERGDQRTRRRVACVWNLGHSSHHHRLDLRADL